MSLSFSQFVSQGGVEGDDQSSLAGSFSNPEEKGINIFDKATTIGQPFQTYGGESGFAAPQKGAFTGYEQNLSLPGRTGTPYEIPDPIYKQNIGSYGFKMADDRG